MRVLPRPCNGVQRGKRTSACVWLYG